VGTCCGCAATACRRGEKPTIVFLFFNDTSISLEVVGVSKNIVLSNATLLNIPCLHASLKRYRMGGMLFCHCVS
jgi:hypothetical protein